MKRKISAGEMLRRFTRQKALIAIVLMLLAMLFFDTNFYTAYNLKDMLNSAAILETLAFSVTLVIICGGVDFSIGAMMSLSGIITIKLMNCMPILPAILIALLCGAAVGFINGLLVVHQKTEPFIITLGMGMLLPIKGRHHALGKLQHLQIIIDGRRLVHRPPWPAL